MTERNGRSEKKNNHHKIKNNFKIGEIEKRKEQSLHKMRNNID